MKAIILAAGYAKRMWPLTKNTPKPLLDVKDKPIIEHIYEKICRCDAIDKVYVVTNNKFAHNFEDWVKGLEKQPKPIEIINDGTLTEEDKLGAIGDMNLVINEKGINEDLMVLGGDNLFGFELSEFADFFGAKGSTTVAFRDVGDLEIIKGRFGMGVADDNYLLKDFIEKPENPTSTLAATCMYIFKGADVAQIKEYLSDKNNPDQTGHFIAWLIKKNPVHAFSFDSQWFDIGSFEGLGLARDKYKG